MYSRPLSTEAHAALLAEWQRHGLRDRVRIVAVLDECTCLACLEADARVLSLRDATREQVLPCKGCTCECGCRCRYRPILTACTANFAPPYEKRRAATKMARIRSLMKSRTALGDGQPGISRLVRASSHGNSAR
jgi:hypothetical protein